MNKEQKEEWILQKFLELRKVKYKSAERIPSRVAPGSDFLIKYSSNNIEGVEVTELLEWPSHKEGQQRVLEDEFEEYLCEMLDKDRYKRYSFVFYRIFYPASKEILRKHVEEVVKKIDLLYEERQLTDRKRFTVDDQKVYVLHNSNRNDGPHFYFLSYGVDGVGASDRKSFFKGLEQRIEEKLYKSNKYIKDYPIHLVIYDNTRYSIFIIDIQGEVHKELGKIDKGDFKYIWLLSGNHLFKIA